MGFIHEKIVSVYPECWHFFLAFSVELLAQVVSTSLIWVFGKAAMLCSLRNLSFFFYSWIEAKRFALPQRDVEDIKKCIQDPFTKNKSVGSHKCCYDEAWLLCSYADRWRKKPVLSINCINGLWGNFCYLTSEVSYSGSSTTPSVSPGKCGEAISFFNALFDCEQVIILNKWKGRSLTWNRRSLLPIITYWSISVATIMICWF